MRIIFCGSSDFAVPSLRAIASGGHQVVLVITQPARPAGRGGKTRPTDIFLAAGPMGLQCVECPDINAPAFVRAMAEKAADCICVADFGQLIRHSARDAAKFGAFNLHGSLLPELRGAAPVNWAIIRGHETTGVTTFQLVDKMDAGPVYLRESVEIDSSWTAMELRAALAEIGAGAACRTLDMIAAGAKPVEQDHSKATAAPKLRKSDGIIDWAAPAQEVRNLIHGTWPWPAGQAEFAGGSGKQTSVAIARAAVEPQKDVAATVLQSGELDGNLCVACGEGRLRILQIQPAGKRLMDWRDFVNGYRVAKGDRFTASGK
ncbi:MAG: methionyl-tRNA formyltransferase [Planctomycetes bacterium]|nr:methionyl-tRNA formyltransferase [Planctomycetota bacterium]